MPGDDVLAADIVLDLGLRHSYDHLLEFVSDFTEIVFMIRVSLVHPDGGRRFDKQYRVDLFAVRQGR